MNDLIVGQPGGRSAWAGRAPLLIAAGLICLISGFNLSRLVTARSPRNPWESIEVLEAWRSLRGMPVYELSPDGHATHMYGAWVPWIQGEIFRWVGPNNISGRLLTLGAALATVTLLALSVRGRRPAWELAIAWAAILGVNHRSGQYFAENRPDMPALMFAALAVLLLGYGLEARRGLSIVLGTACLVAGFFLKQTVAIFAAVPLVALVWKTRRPARSEVLLALIPPAVIGGVILGLKVLSPTVYHYMVEVPGAYAIAWPRVAKFGWELLLDSPLFLVLLAEWIICDRGSLQADPRIVWLVSVLAVTVPFSVLSYAKVGGWPNSQLPALLAMMTFCGLRLPRLLRRTEDPATPARSRVMMGVVLAVFLLMTTFPHLTKANNLIVSRSRWDDSYWRVVSLTNRLPGTVACPEDPTIPLYAQHRVVQNLFSEKDAHPVNGTWPKAVPEAVLAELRTADYVVDVIHYWGENVDDALLDRAGFEPIGGLPLDPECYRIWRRKVNRPAGAPDRTVSRGEGESGPAPSRHR